MVGARGYDRMYRWWAPWDAVGVREDLRRLLGSGHLSPATHPRTLDLGCGTGANVVELASRGYEATGVDFSRVALAKAAARAREAGVQDRCRFVEADLTDPALPELLGGPFDLLTDFGTLDDLDPDGRVVLARHMGRLARPGAVALFWCFYGHRADLPLISFVGPSRVTPGIEPGEEYALFGELFDVAPFSREHRNVACFLLRRRDAGTVVPEGAPAP
jgi:SAM-dependent methyltransferase